MSSITLFEYFDEIKGDYRTYHIGDMIKNQYFSKEHWCVESGLIRLLSENKYHSIDEEWRI